MPSLVLVLGQLVGVMFIVKAGKLQFMTALGQLILASTAIHNTLLELHAKKVNAITIPPALSCVLVQIVLMVMFVYLVVALITKEQLKFVTTIFGELFLIRAGLVLMLELYAISLDILQEVCDSALLIAYHTLCDILLMLSNLHSFILYIQWLHHLLALTMASQTRQFISEMSPALEMSSILQSAQRQCCHCIMVNKHCLILK